MAECYRCKDWQRMGLSDTCPSCDLAHQSPPMTDLRKRLEEWARQTVRGHRGAVLYKYSAHEMLDLLWPVIEAAERLQHVKLNTSDAHDADDALVEALAKLEQELEK